MENAKLCSKAGSWALGGALALVFASVIAFGSYREVSTGATAFEHRAQLAFDKINSAADTVEGVLVSLGVSSGGQMDLGRTHQVAQAVLSQYRFVTAMGRFGQLSAGQRKTYDAERRDVSGAGVWEFEYRLGDDSSIVTARPRALHFPVLYATGRQGSMRGLAGFDLAFEPTLGKALGDALSSNQSALLKAEHSLSAGGQLWVVGGVSNAADANASGHWVELDLLDMVLAGSEWPGFTEASIELIARSFEFDEFAAEPVRLLDTSVGIDGGGQFAVPFLQPHQWRGVFDVGGHTLRATFAQTPQISWHSLAVNTGLATLVALMMFAVFLLNLRRRAAVRLQQAQVVKLHKTQQQASVTLASIRDTVITIDKSAKIVYANAAANDLLKRQVDGIVNQPIDEILRLSDDRRDRRHPEGRSVSPDFLSNEQTTSEYNLERGNGEHVPVSQTNSPLYDIDGKRAGNVLVLRDISVERELTAALQHQANHDPLTGIANRLKFEQVMAELFLPDAENERGHALCYIDLDQFKLVNDTCGHAAGDELLVNLVTGLRRTVREHDLIARLGGDEFSIIIRDCSAESAEIVVQRVYNYFQSSYFRHNGEVFPVRASIGHVHFKPGQCTIEELLLAADAACYEAKRLGRNQVCLRRMSDEYNLQATAQLCGSELQRAVDKGQFQFLTSVIRSANCFVSLGVEYRIALELPSRRCIHDSEINPVAERHGLMKEIDRWLIEQSITQFCAQSGHVDVLLMIRLSTATLSDSNVVTDIRKIVDQSGLSSDRLCVVVGQECLLKNPKSLQIALSRLRTEGFRIAVVCVDASADLIGVLASIPIDYLKFDYHHSCEDANGRAVVMKLLASMQSLAQVVEAELVLENIVEDRVLELCQELGICWVQAPMVADARVSLKVSRVA